jgi:hypothetical protein
MGAGSRRYDNHSLLVKATDRRGLSGLQLVSVHGTRLVSELGERQFKASMPRLKGM